MSSGFAKKMVLVRIIEISADLLLDETKPFSERLSVN